MPLSETFKRAIFAEASEEVAVCLLTIFATNSQEVHRLSSHPSVRTSDDPLLYVTISRGQSYLFLPFGFVPPDSGDDSPRGAQLVLTNIGRELVPMVRSVTGTIKVHAELALESNPDAVEMGIYDLEVLEVRGTADNLAFTLGYRTLLREPVPWLSFLPAWFPALAR